MGALLASTGLPLVIELGSKLCGKGLSVPKKAGRGLTVSPKPGMMLYQPPPFIGSWNNPIGMGGKKKIPKKGQGLLLGPNSPLNSIPILGNIL